MSKKYVKFDDKYFLVEVDVADEDRQRTHGSEGFKLVPIDEDEILTLEAEKAILKESDFSHTSNILQEGIDEARSELKDMFKDNIKKTVLGALGFRHGWGKFEIDPHSNRSDIGDLILKEVKEFILEDQLRVTKGDFLTVEERVELIASTKQEFRDTYRQELRRGLCDEARDKAREKAKEIVNNILEDKLKGSIEEYAEKAFESE